MLTTNLCQNITFYVHRIFPIQPTFLDHILQNFRCPARPCSYAWLSLNKSLEAILKPYALHVLGFDNESAKRTQS